MKPRKLAEALSSSDLVVAPGLYDMISAIVANKVGFDFVYASGYWLTASGYGLPDAGIASYTQMLDRVALLCEISDAAVIADADTGFGGLLNVAHTVSGYEKAGVAAIQIEDQVFPKRCGHMTGRQVIPLKEMVRKIEVAADTRSEMLVIARTDARQPEDFERAIKRGQAYAAAGADIVFIEALESEEEMRRACELIDAPMIANMANGGVTPILTVDELKAIGYQAAIFPAMAPLAAAMAVEKALVHLKQTGSSISKDIPHFDFAEFSGLIGFDEIHAFDRKWAD